LSPSCSELGKGRKAHNKAMINHMSTPHKMMRKSFQSLPIVGDVWLAMSGEKRSYPAVKGKCSDLMTMKGG
jgi:hypothetical protein